MTIHTEQLITHAVNLIQHCKNNTAGFSKTSKIPSHLAYDVRRIEHQWHTTSFITETDVKYLEHIYASSEDYLRTHVYMLGGWHKYKSYRHASHNMRSQTRLKRAKLRYSL